MKRVLLLGLLMLCAGVSSGQAAQINTCPPSGKAISVDFKTLAPPPIYNNRLDVQGIRNLFREHTAAVVGPHERALGITYAVTTFTLGGSTMIHPAKGGFCAYLDKIEASFGWERMDVFIASEFKPGTCEYRTVLDHENQHVSIDNAALKEFAPRFRAALERAIAEQRPLYTASRQGAANVMLEEIRSRLEIQMEEFQRLMEDRNAPLDSASNYHETAKLCSNWDGESAPPSPQRAPKK